MSRLPALILITVLFSLPAFAGFGPEIPIASPVYGPAIGEAYNNQTVFLQAIEIDADGNLAPSRIQFGSGTEMPVAPARVATQPLYGGIARVFMHQWIPQRRRPAPAR